MKNYNDRVDDYIEKSPEFARPILIHLREIVHKACPDIEETIKWRAPFFEYNGLVCMMAAFKKHCCFGFWKQSLLESELFEKEKTAMGSLGKITTIEQLPAESELIRLIRKAVELNVNGIKVDKKAAKSRPLPKTPKGLADALKQNKAAKAFFDKMSPSHKREYIEWIMEAKTQPTREKRIATTIEWLSEGKSRNWKYEKKK